MAAGRHWRLQFAAACCISAAVVHVLARTCRQACLPSFAPRAAFTLHALPTNSHSLHYSTAEDQAGADTYFYDLNHFHLLEERAEERAEEQAGEQDLDW